MEATEISLYRFKLCQLSSSSRRRKSLFEYLGNVHCTDIDEVTYLNQVWPGFSNLSLVCFMKLSFTAQEQWTIGIIDYAAVGDEFVLQIESYPSLRVGDQTLQLLFAVSVQAAYSSCFCYWS